MIWNSAVKERLFAIRSRLLMLALLSVVPAAGILSFWALEQRAQARSQAKEEVLRMARGAAAHHAQLVSSVHQVLHALSHVPVVAHPRNTDACQRVLAASRARQPMIANLGVIGADGRLLCSAVDGRKGMDLTDRAYFRRALETGEFARGDFQVGRIVGKATVNFGYPVKDRQGRVRVVLFAAVGLSSLNSYLAQLELPAGAELTVTDINHVILARYPTEQNWVGKTAPESSFIRGMLMSGNEGTTEAEGLDRTRRLYAFHALGEAGTTLAYVSIGMPATTAYRSAERIYVNALGTMAWVSVLVLLATWLGGEVFVVRPIAALSRAITRLSAGDLTARVRLQGPTELRALAGTLNELAERLESRGKQVDAATRALRTLSAANRALLRASDEQALLEAICRVVVRVGGYRLAWVWYAKDEDPMRLTPVAQAGLDGQTFGRIAQRIATLTDRAAISTPIARAARTRRPQILDDQAVQDMAVVFEGNVTGVSETMLVLPLTVDARLIGALVVHAREPAAFDDQARNLLLEMAHDAAFGLGAIRARVLHRKADETIKRMAYFDELTGLPNRVQMQSKLRDELAKRDHRQPFAMLLVDVDRFREINNTLGYDSGDAVLKAVAQRLSAAAPPGSLVSRQGEDEFAMLIPDGERDSAVELASALLRILTQPVYQRGVPLDVSASIGVALYPDHGDSADALRRAADTAMHEAKYKGTGCWVFDAGNQQASADRLAVAAELRRAIERRELLPYFQPKLDMASRRVTGAEVLVRWLHAERGLVPPTEFIPLAEHTGLIGPLTYWLIDAAARIARHWHEEGIDLPLAVNLSARNFRDPALVGYIEGMLRRHHIKAEWLQLELTESSIMEDPEKGMMLLSRLCELGFRLFIDDFGTGYSSLAYLKKLPVSAIKIDKSFTSGLPEDAEAFAIVRSTIELGHNMGMSIVAEGVERQAAWDLLASLGCDEAQGYFIGRPMPAEEFVRWFRDYGREAER